MMFDSRICFPLPLCSQLNSENITFLCFAHSFFIHKIHTRVLPQPIDVVACSLHSLSFTGVTREAYDFAMSNYLCHTCRITLRFNLNLH